ncbi:uncharacterized protein Z520_02679 [Fonsecaea multimorphosa CBS 102226]|uniref:glucose oxidase n=1 Tax=Fonsecaea multimorphosa CBS 102226 TaxID=1442371 RepID=A0A0D2IVP0_9EURO|nr:uncharacterized protein Z520_02679 [Fonsecaea multimorphosa CBS 102226]KIY01127.1 hypothetical protein Z520_02679 [Fonsecaea multimorphosa CBS 102226]OAL28748.1 hypothetical protein AYO22_02613 [Fonsecaea multimorphosa]
MRCSLSVVLAAAAGIALAAPSAHESRNTHLRTRNIIDGTSIADSYDFVIVGGGLAGLVLGARLSEDANHTVLVLEAGSDGDEYRDRIDTPAYAYYESLWPTDLNWAFTTTPQPNANNSQCPWPRGKVLGGSSAINGMYLNRPGEIEINAWQDMLGDMDGAENWSWDAMFAAMKKSETFSPPVDASIQQEAAITYNPASHGSQGPIHMSYPGFTMPLVGAWSSTANNAGVDDTQDPYGGENWGAYVATSAINPANWTRSYSRSGYLDPLPPRSNYDVVANAQVTRILFSNTSGGNLTAHAVEYVLNGAGEKLTVGVNKEVILAAGTVGSPTVLLYSGVGPKDVLDAAGVTVVSELPGVGQHLQDHISVTVTWSTDAQTAGTIYEANGTESTNPAFLSYVNSATAYVNSSVLFGNGVSGLQSSILGEIDSYIPDTSSDTSVISGYKTIYSATANTILTSPIGLIELVIGLSTNGSIQIGANLQHPFSHGQISINSSDPLDYPVINPNYLNHPADVEILREGVKLARVLGETEPLAGNMIEETWPGSDVQTDEEWEDWLRGEVFTEFHPSSSCAMLPLEQGGVVDANLRVYGLSNVRVADASVPPIAFSAHLMSSTYGLAEQASTIIRNFYDQTTSSTKHHNSTTNSTGSSNSQASSNGNGTAILNTTNTPPTINASSSANTNSNGAASLSCWPLSTVALLCMAIEFLL